MALALIWAALLATLLAALAMVRPRGPGLKLAVRLLPDVLRLIRRLAAGLPRGVRVRPALLLATGTPPVAT